MKNKSKDFLKILLAVFVSFVFVVVMVNATTDIGLNITTGGTLSVTGASTLT